MMATTINTAKQNTGTNRAYYLDWIRVITILIVFLFHTGRFFDSDDWHVKNVVTYPLADALLFLLKQWMMPLFFFISGASTWYALNAKSGGKFTADRVKRILVPLLFGIFILSPPQVYLERFSHGQFPGSFWQFIPHYFSGWYAFGGNFAWMGLHLWYLLLLFIFSLLLLPLFSWWKKRTGKTGNVSPLWVLLIFVILLAVPDLLLSLDNPLVNRGFGGWGLLEHLVVFIAGYYAYARLNMEALVIRFRLLFLVLAISLTALNFYLFLNHIRYESGTMGYCLKMLLRSAVCFTWILMILGFAAKHLKSINRLLRYGNEAVLPFYIIHQPVLLLTGYFLVRTGMNPVNKYLLIAAISFAVVMISYELVIKKLRILRFLFGMGNPAKSLPSTSQNKAA